MAAVGEFLSFPNREIQLYFFDQPLEGSEGGLPVRGRNCSAQGYLADLEVTHSVYDGHLEGPRSLRHIVCDLLYHCVGIGMSLVVDRSDRACVVVIAHLTTEGDDRPSSVACNLTGELFHADGFAADPGARH